MNGTVSQSWNETQNGIINERGSISNKAIFENIKKKLSQSGYVMNRLFVISTSDLKTTLSRTSIPYYDQFIDDEGEMDSDLRYLEHIQGNHYEVKIGFFYFNSLPNEEKQRVSSWHKVDSAFINMTASYNGDTNSENVSSVKLSIKIGDLIKNFMNGQFGMSHSQLLSMRSVIIAFAKKIGIGLSDLQTELKIEINPSQNGNPQEVVTLVDGAEPLLKSKLNKTYWLDQITLGQFRRDLGLYLNKNICTKILAKEKNQI